MGNSNSYGGDPPLSNVTLPTDDTAHEIVVADSS